MKILSAAQIRELDKYTIENEPIASIDLMERASIAFCKWFTLKFDNSYSILILAGTGNNGGDGLAIARLLKAEGYNIEVCIIGVIDNGSADFKINLERLPNNIIVHYAYTNEDFTNLPEKFIFIDAIFGSGLNRPIEEGIISNVIKFLNTSQSLKIAVDIPSGLFCDKLNSVNDSIVKADFTLTFQLPKTCFLYQENEQFIGDWSVAEIGLNPVFIEQTQSDFEFIIKEDISKRIKKRTKFSHKGTFGHALILAGSYGKIGAAVLSGMSCLKTGVGLLTMQVPKCGYEVMQTSIPEAMCIADDFNNGFTISTLPDLSTYNSIGIGPGIGQTDSVRDLLENLIRSYKKPIVFDADALNLLSRNKNLLEILPPDSILTPHPKEFERLTSKAINSQHRLELLKEFSIKYKCITILKGAYSATCSTEGKIYFNSTGNPGMATGGSGDVLTGILTSLLAQGYEAIDAAILGVYLHGFAGDEAAKILCYESLVASDITKHIYRFFKEFIPQD